ncbi:MAG: glutamine-hydrolyzing GMP synthase [Defluviitaleaceae bacterium]|nr:glutamine-hydrolyzing GMP synthase [Defluviitaleaceae bacterium]
MKKEMILVVDFGSHHKEAVARNVRDLGVYSEIRPGNISIEAIKEIAPIGIITTCNEQQCLDADFSTLNIPVLCINHPQKDDLGLLRSFLMDTCKASASYTVQGYLDEKVAEIKDAVGDQKVLLALSGGVDSSVTAALLSRAIPGQLTCIFVNHGFMRKDEPQQVEATFANKDLNFIHIDASQRFLDKLADVVDPEEKRKIIGNEFIYVFEEEAKKLGDIPFFAQGTIYPDIVESGGDYGTLIKSHHNVGGLPEKLGFKKIIEPLAGLFKDEVRRLGTLLELPPELVNRQPFPGPGLAVRVMGPITKEKLDTLREADAITRATIEEHLSHNLPAQYFCVLTDTKSVGVKNNTRTYDYAIAIRAVQTQDFMTAGYYPIPHDVLGEIATRITQNVPAASRIVYDITSKPPGTVEWQ